MPLAVDFQGGVSRLLVECDHLCPEAGRCLCVSPGGYLIQVSLRPGKVLNGRLDSAVAWRPPGPARKALRHLGIIAKLAFGSSCVLEIALGFGPTRSGHAPGPIATAHWWGYRHIVSPRHRQASPTCLHLCPASLVVSQAKGAGSAVWSLALRGLDQLQTPPDVTGLWYAIWHRGRSAWRVGGRDQDHAALWGGPIPHRERATELSSRQSPQSRLRPGAAGYP